MTEENQYDKAARLRHRAEESARTRIPEEPPDVTLLPPEELRRMVHELQVHQIELEMQNEELRSAHLELDASRAQYFDLYDLAPVGYITINDKGFILEANLTAAGLWGMARGALVRQPFTRFILKEDQDIFYRHRKILFETGKPQSCELRMVKADGRAFWIELVCTYATLETDKEPVCRINLKDISERKKAELSLKNQNISLSKLNKFAIGLSNLSVEDNLEAFIATQIKEITGAIISTFSEYDPLESSLIFRHIELDPKIIKKITPLIGGFEKYIKTSLPGTIHENMSREMIRNYKDLNELSFGIVT